MRAVSSTGGAQRSAASSRPERGSAEGRAAGCGRLGFCTVVELQVSSSRPPVALPSPFTRPHALLLAGTPAAALAAAARRLVDPSRRMPGPECAMAETLSSNIVNYLGTLPRPRCCAPLTRCSLALPAGGGLR